MPIVDETGLRLVIKDEFTKAMDDFASKSAKMQQQMQKQKESWSTLTTSMALGGAAIVAVLGKMVQASMKEDEAYSKVARTMSTHGGDYDTIKKKMMEFGEVMETKMPYSSEQYMTAIETLVVKGHMPLDLAIKNSTGMMTLMASTGMEGRRALSYISDEAKRGHDVLTEYALAAQKPMSATQQWTVATNTMGQAMKNLGDVLVPTVLQMAKAVEALSIWFINLPAPIKTVLADGLALTGVFLTLVGVGAKMVSMFVTLAPAVATAGEAIMNMNPAILGVTVAITGLIAVEEYLLHLLADTSTLNAQAAAQNQYADAIQKLKDKETPEHFNQIMTAMNATHPPAEQAANDLKKLIEGFGKAGEGAKEAAKAHEELCKKFVKDEDNMFIAAQAETSYIIKSDDEKKRADYAYWDAAIAKAKAAGKDSEELDKKGLEAKKANNEQSLKWFTDMENSMTSSFSSTIDNFIKTGGSFTDFISAMANDVIGIWEKMIADMIAKWAASGVMNMVGSAFNVGGGEATGIAGTVASAAGGAGGIGSMIGGAGAALGGAAGAVGGAVSAGMGAIGAGLAVAAPILAPIAIGAAIVEGIGSLFHTSSHEDVMKAFYNNYKGYRQKGMPSGYAKFVAGLMIGGQPASDADFAKAGMPLLASGGYIKSAGVAYLHKGETVTPAGKTNNVFNINVASLDSKTDLRRLVEDMSYLWERKMKTAVV